MSVFAAAEWLRENSGNRKSSGWSVGSSSESGWFVWAVRPEETLTTHRTNNKLLQHFSLQLTDCLDCETNESNNYKREFLGELNIFNKFKHNCKYEEELHVTVTWAELLEEVWWSCDAIQTSDRKRNCHQNKRCYLHVPSELYFCKLRPESALNRRLYRCQLPLLDKLRDVDIKSELSVRNIWIFWIFTAAVSC